MRISINLRDVLLYNPEFNRSAKTGQSLFKDKRNGENMKSVSKRGWITKLGGAVLASFLALPVYAQLMLAHEGHHSGGDCSIKTGDFHVSMSIYEAMEGGIPPMHAYCDSVPNTGKVSITLEIPPPARQMVLAVRLVKDGHGGHGGHAAPVAAEQKTAESNEHDGHGDHDGHEGMDHDAHAEHGAAEPGIAYLPPQKHNSGIIVLTANLQEKGQYAIQLEKHENGSVRTAVNIPISVGKGGGHAGHGGGIGMVEIILLLGAVGGAAFYFMRRKKAAV